MYWYFDRMVSDAKKPNEMNSSLKIVDITVENAIHRVFIEIYVCTALIHPDFPRNGEIRQIYALNRRFYSRENRATRMDKRGRNYDMANRFK